MGERSGIQWTEATWNPVAGCSLKSAGCKNCYAMREAHRLGSRSAKYAGLTKAVNGHPLWTGELRLWEPALNEPLRWRAPRRIFVNSMSDLFHESLSDEQIGRVFEVMGAARQHEYQILTKRPERMLAFVRKYATPGGPLGQWPWLHVWLGISAEHQEAFDERYPYLAKTEAWVRFVSYEPALGPIDFRMRRVGSCSAELRCPTCEGSCSVPGGGVACPTCFDSPEGQGGFAAPDWIIVGGESGPSARAFDLSWARAAVAQGRVARVPIFVKQLGSRPCSCANAHDATTEAPWERLRLVDRKGGDQSEWPEDLRVREYPSRVA